ncbi:hypothetical protein BGZ54_001194 [Gamsiella multidivaricata]|nr:hypothetical protein BGZ54_001194 [Gamsiella multidivaricata]
MAYDDTPFHTDNNSITGQIQERYAERTHIVGSDYIKGFDVVVFEECFAATPCSILRDGLKNQYSYHNFGVGLYIG